jgi:Nucleotidyltransferase of unknown function (DUF6036)
MDSSPAGSGSASLGLSREQIDNLLQRVSQEAVRRETNVSIFLIGGAAMALAYSTSRSTRDLDGIFEPKSIVYEIARAVAADVPELNLAPDWLNDAAKGFMPGEDANATVYFDGPGLSVRIASPRYLFVMKAIAARETDVDDLRILFHLCEFTSANEAMDEVLAAYPTRTMKPNVQYLIEEIAMEILGKS